MILLAHSARDPAGMNIADKVLKEYAFMKTDLTFQETCIYTAEFRNQRVDSITLRDESVNAQNLPESFPSAELIVFLSRHSSQSGKPTLSVHTPGNLGKADLGGLPNTVSVSPAASMQTALTVLNNAKEEMKLEYEVSYECTHHGPSLQVPTMFVELGSSEKQWHDQNAAMAVAKAAVETISDFGKSKETAVLGIGGTHYNQKFTRISLEGKAAFGHMIPKYALSNVTTTILRHCIARTKEKVDYASLDWKGIRSEDKSKVVLALKEIDLPIEKV